MRVFLGRTGFILAAMMVARGIFVAGLCLHRGIELGPALLRMLPHDLVLVLCGAVATAGLLGLEGRRPRRWVWVAAPWILVAAASFLGILAYFGPDARFGPEFLWTGVFRGLIGWVVPGLAVCALLDWRDRSRAGGKALPSSPPRRLSLD